MGTVNMRKLEYLADKLMILRVCQKYSVKRTHV